MRLESLAKSPIRLHGNGPALDLKACLRCRYAIDAFILLMFPASWEGGCQLDGFCA